MIAIDLRLSRVAIMLNKITQKHWQKETVGAWSPVNHIRIYIRAKQNNTRYLCVTVSLVTTVTVPLQDQMHHTTINYQYHTEGKN